GVGRLILTSLVVGYCILLFLPTSSSTLSFNVHAQHILLAQQAQNPTSLPNSTQNIPGLRGDRTLRYTVSFNHPDTIQPNQDTQLQFQVFDASSGNKIQFFQTVYEKPL